MLPTGSLIRDLSVRELLLQIAPLYPRPLPVGEAIALVSIFGGVFFPVRHGALHAIATLLPSYWLVQAGQVAVGGKGRTTEGSSSCSPGRRGSRRRRRGRTAATPAAPDGVGTIALAMADERELSLQEQLEGIGAQLDWVRGYL